MHFNKGLSELLKTEAPAHIQCSERCGSEESAWREWGRNKG